MISTKEIGDYGEEVAREFLIKKGVTILDRNFRGKAGEIDIIAQEGHNLVFVEVKSRKNKDFVTARESVNLAKQKKIKNTAREYIANRKIKYKYVRFDIIEYYSDNNEIEHFIDAF